MFCAKCGNEIAEGSTSCSVCGSPAPNPSEGSRRPSLKSSVVLVGDCNLYAVISLLCAVASCTSLSLLMIVATFVFGSIARRQFSEKGPAAGRGAGMVTAAYIVAGLGIVLRVALILCAVSFVGGLVTSYQQALMAF